MEVKFCTVCKLEKPISEFWMKPNGKYHSWCNNCRKRKKKEWDDSHVQHRKKYRDKNSEHIKKINAIYKEQNYDKIKEAWTKSNERLREKRRIDRLKPENREREKERGRKWRKENRERYNKYFHDYYERDESKKIGRNLRNRLRKVLKGIASAIHLNGLTGCSLDFLKGYLESLFTDGMTWSNYGLWHVDHILPCNAFNFNDPVHQRACFYWKNLRPLWGSKNISKNDNYNPRDFDAYMKWFIGNVVNK